MTPIQAMQPLFKQVECGYRPVPHNVEPPIAEAGRIQAKLRELKIEREQYRQLLDTTERLILHYESLQVPF